VVNDKKGQISDILYIARKFSPILFKSQLFIAHFHLTLNEMPDLWRDVSTDTEKMLIYYNLFMRHVDFMLVTVTVCVKLG
jgi:hypothetical protein